MLAKSLVENLPFMELQIAYTSIRKVCDCVINHKLFSGVLHEQSIDHKRGKSVCVVDAEAAITHFSQTFLTNLQFTDF